VLGETDAVIIGASAGPAVAAQLQAAVLPFEPLEQAQGVGATSRRRRDQQPASRASSPAGGRFVTPPARSHRPARRAGSMGGASATRTHDAPGARG
jgi:hypothetical protein